MLVLTRRRGEKIHIGDGIVITVVDVFNGRVRIGIEAPRDQPIYRDTVYEAIKNGEPDPRIANKQE